MTPEAFRTLAARYRNLCIAVLGDFCLDRYLEVDATRKETSIETGLPVHNVSRVRAQPGGAGTILNNLAAVGIGTLYPIGFAGEDGEGFELRRALGNLPGVDLRYFLQTAQRGTFTYCKPLVLESGKPPVELNRLDFKNWTATPEAVQEQVSERMREAVAKADALIVLDQVDLPESGVVTRKILAALRSLLESRPELLALGDSRRGLRDFPPMVFKMNRAELGALTSQGPDLTLEQSRQSASQLARANGRLVFVTLAEQGLLGAEPAGGVEHVPALPLRGQIDVVGAGDAVSANVAAALAAGAPWRDALHLANAAASVVVHKLGTTGTATVTEIAALLA